MGARLEFGILGPLEVRLDGTPVRVGGARQRALLAMLLCNANRVVSHDRLIDELRGNEPTGSSDRLLRVQISRLRKVLAHDGDGPRLLARARGYLLRVEDGELDLHAFDRLVMAGRQALEQGDPSRAAATLRAAESLWRGDPLADLGFEPFARVEIRRLEELRASAVEERIEVELALGRHAALCAELEALVAEYPLRERLRGQLMLALYRSARQAEALATYRAGRALFCEELGLEPAPQLRHLEQAILRQDPSLDVTVVPRADRGPARAVAAPPAETAEPPAEPAPHRDGRRRLRSAALVGLMVAALSASAVAAKLVTAAHHPLTLKGNALALIDPGGGMLQAMVKLPTPPADVASGFGSLWVAEPDGGVVVCIDARRRNVIATIPVGRRPTRVVTAAGQVWVLDTVDGTLSRIDPNTDAVAQTVEVGTDSRDVAVSAGSAWIVNRRGGTVRRIDPRTGRTLLVVRTAAGADAIAASVDALWVANDEAGTVTRIDARSGQVTGTIRVGDAPAAIVASASGVWVADRLDATLSRIDPRRNAVDATLPLGGSLGDLTVLGGAVWVSDQRQGVLYRVDAQRAALLNMIHVGGDPGRLASNGGLWLASDAVGPSHRGGTVTSVSSSGALDTIDPAASTSVNLPQPRLFGLTNDGLVTLNHSGGPDGARLVPDLALALPVPTDHGRTYTFQMRPGIRYSTGELVRPSDVTHSFVRLFQLDSSGAAYFRPILGASGCARATTTCDLYRGIVADDRAHTVTFHLTQADPDFLYKLTLTYADVLPASIPGREARTPLPATGPYLITSYSPEHELRMVRNPRFREWSTAAQPDGYPDQIVIRLGLTGQQAATAVAAGKADFLADFGTTSVAATNLMAQHPSQVHVNPSMATNALALNVTAPPFDDVRVRQALNLALDRNRIGAAYGGPAVATPTCQILPPQLPGYRRYCPYTREPNSDGRYRGPDLAKARRLVAASGTKGMTVTVWDDSVAIGEARLTVAALNQLGYRASLRLLPDSTYFTYTNDSRNHAQVIDGGWGADYPSANDFLGKLTCRYYVPGNGLANTDASDFCDPAFDKLAAQAAALQATDATAANKRWASLDHRLTDLAIWLPTITPNETDLVSRHVSNYQYNPVWGALVDQMWVR